MMPNYDIYCLSFNNPTRRTAMEYRFNQLGVKVCISEGVSVDDEKIRGRNMSDNEQKAWSIAYGHLSMMKEFYFNSNKPYGIFCEDDIYIRKDFLTQLPHCIVNFEERGLDTLLLGYLTCWDVSRYPKVSDEHPFSYSPYDDNIWGTQMYMLSRNQAWYLINKYSPPYADLSRVNNDMKPFSADWVFTKEGNRALIYPPLVIEDGKTKYKDEGQQIFHDRCHVHSYVEGLFI